MVLGDVMEISQPTISRILYCVSRLFASLLKDYIKMPSTEAARQENHTSFKELGQGQGAIGLPGIDGAIDCTHIRLTYARMRNLAEAYRNRKGYFSLNVQTVVGSQMEYLDIVPQYARSTHDSRIFQNSRIYMCYTERQLQGSLVGDAGYPCLPFLLTLIRNPETDEQQMYNIIHARTRNIVERTYGVWKRQFPCLSKGLTVKLKCCTTIIVACAVLHNLSHQYNDVLPEDEPEIQEDDVPPWATTTGNLQMDLSYVRHS